MNAVMDHTDATLMHPAAIQLVAINVVVVVVLLEMDIPAQVRIKHFEIVSVFITTFND